MQQPCGRFAMGAAEFPVLKGFGNSTGGASDAQIIFV